MPEPLHERLERVLKDSGMDGCLLLVYRTPEPADSSCASYVFAINNIKEKEAIATVLQACSEMVAAYRPPRKPKAEPPLDAGMSAVDGVFPPAA